LLISAVSQALQLACSKGFKSISIPAISCGIYGYPKEQATQIIAQTVYDFLNKPNCSLHTIRIIDKDEQILQLFILQFKDLASNNSTTVTANEVTKIQRSFDVGILAF